MINFSPKDIIANNLTLHTEAFGNPSNPACILVACKQGTARFWSDQFCQYIANQGFFVIRYDHRDVGQSSTIDWEKAPYTMTDMAHDAILLLDGYGIHKAHFIGDSMGGWICQRIGVDYPERVQSLVIISAGPIEITDKTVIPETAQERKEAFDRVHALFAMRKDGTTLDQTVRSYLPIWKQFNADIPLDEEMANNYTFDFLARTTHKDTVDNHERMFQAFLAGMKRTHTLHTIACPTLVIHGDKDFLVQPQLGQAIADAIPNAKMVMIHGMGHTFFNRALEGKIAKLVVEHIKKEKLL
jgi:pimeloyl-ACP methyl ester carboxylesterase